MESDSDSLAMIYPLPPLKPCEILLAFALLRHELEQSGQPEMHVSPTKLNKNRRPTSGRLQRSVIHALSVMTTGHDAPRKLIKFPYNQFIPNFSLVKKLLQIGD